MKRLIIGISVLLTSTLTSCRSCQTTQNERQIGLRKVCKTCVLTYTQYSNEYFATDTLSPARPVYKVTFCVGGPFSAYSANEVDHMDKVN